MTYTADLVAERFNNAQIYADQSLTYVEEFMDKLEALLASLEEPDTDSIDDVGLPTVAPIDFSSIPDYDQVLQDFPTLANLTAPPDPTLDTVPDVTATVGTKNFNFISNTPTLQTLNFPPDPGTGPTLTTVTVPSKPTYTTPTAPPAWTPKVVPGLPSISMPSLGTTALNLQSQPDPTSFSFTEGTYQSDIRIELFKKIIDDIKNGGTGLSATVEADIYDRFLARQQAENDRLYQEVQDQFAATGFGLPSGALAARLLQVSSEISQKNDQASREITISQAELAQKNTHFTLEQAGILEKILVDFFNSQQNRALQAQQAIAANAIDIFNAKVSENNLFIQEWQAEITAFDARIKRELSVLEAYRIEIEGVRADTEVQQARVALYNAEWEAVKTINDIFRIESENAKIAAEIQALAVETFRAQVEVFAKKLEGEKLKVEIYGTEVDAEKTRADAFKNEVEAYEAEVRAKLGEVEAQRVQAANKIATNQLKIEQYRAKLDGYRTEIETELKTANLLVTGYSAKTDAYKATVSAKEMEFRARVAEVENKISLARAQMEKAKAILEATTSSYVALKELQVKGTEGIMNVNAQLAASAMNAVNASASQAISSSSSDSESISESHNYQYDDGPGSPL